MRVMTWNLLTETSVDAPPWSVRGPAVAARVADLAPAVLGAQEGSRVMLDDLVSRLPARYRWVGEGRGGSGHDEHGAVVYDTGVLTLLDLRHRWLSPTPEVPGSQASDADLPRMLTAARFHLRESGAAITVVSTHLDHLGAQARVDGAALVAAEATTGPTVVLGDFNDPAEDSEAYRILTRSGLVDALAPRNRPDQRLRTFTGLYPDGAAEGEGEQIDWVLVTPDITVSDAWVVAGPSGEDLPSDHRPVVADLVVPAQAG
jgi:endonuclease/exonuclease/phosphatase family metal-dependent hydrolase